MALAISLWRFSLQILLWHYQVETRSRQVFNIKLYLFYWFEVEVVKAKGWFFWIDVPFIHINNHDWWTTEKGTQRIITGKVFWWKTGYEGRAVDGT